MKLTEVKVWLVEGVKYNWTMMKVITDTGHTGAGEATHWPGSPISEVAERARTGKLHPVGRLGSAHEIGVLMQDS